MKTFFLSALGLALCLLLSSCETLSENPLGSPEKSHADQRLSGTWRMKKSGDLLTFRMTKGAWMHVVITPGNPHDQPDSYDLFPTLIGKERFLNVRQVGKDDQGHPTTGYYFLRYTISGDHVLQMWMISQDAAAAAVQAGKLKGTVHEDKSPLMAGKPPHPDVDVTLQDTSAHLVQFIQGADLDALFSDKMETLYRVKPTGN